MKVAIPHCRGRVSPVFDVAGNLLVVRVEDGAERGREQVALGSEDPGRRAARLREAAVDVLVCGAISRPLAAALAGEGIDVIAQTCGELEGVLAAFIDGRVEQGAFRMPGSPGRRPVKVARRQDA